ncbi:Uncharacterized protein SCF082_LOCUS35790 [Durusdinium trenchii]|uniref:Uncharacterized protein n=1 Tax=Durusdinium trenchii TaxID=1381693 RepID=A0ABP0PAU0_9DINO
MMLQILVLLTFLSGSSADNLRGDAHQNATNTTNLKLKAAVAVGKCTKQDEAKMTLLGGGHDAHSFPGKLSSCGKKNYNIFSGFNRNRYNNCVVKETGISSSCSDCFAISAQYGANNCKWKCFWGSWCGKGCLDCVAPQKKLGPAWPSLIQTCTQISIWTAVTYSEKSGSHQGRYT